MRAGTLSILTIAAILAAPAPPARAQMGMAGATRPLGGYGAATITSAYSTGGGPLPYLANGVGVGPVPSGRAPLAGAAAGTPIGGSSASNAMGQGGMRAVGPGRRAYGPLLPTGGMGPGRASGMSRAERPGLGFGSPFRQPPGLGGPAAMGMP